MVALPLALGILSYVVFRAWVPFVGAHAALWPTAPHALRDHFADAMWGFALGAFVSLMWSNAKRAHRLAWLGAAMLTAAGMELLQLKHTWGGFDSVDLVVQTGSVLVAATVIGGMNRWTWANGTH
jgi:hypothetical protein